MINDCRCERLNGRVYFYHSGRYSVSFVCRLHGITSGAEKPNTALSMIDPPVHEPRRSNSRSLKSARFESR